MLLLANCWSRLKQSSIFEFSFIRLSAGIESTVLSVHLRERWWRSFELCCWIRASQVPQLYCILPKKRLGTLTRSELTQSNGTQSSWSIKSWNGSSPFHTSRTSSSNIFVCCRISWCSLKKIQFEAKRQFHHLQVFFACVAAEEEVAIVETALVVHLPPISLIALTIRAPAPGRRGGNA